jgi:uncharacterized protein HemX
MTWVLTLLGTLVPALPALRSALYGALLAAIVAGGGWLVWTLRHQDEAPRIARQAKAIVDAANLQAHVEQLEAAHKQAEATLAARETDLAASQRELAALKTKQEELRRGTENPDGVCIPAGDPWLGGVRR